MHTANKVLLNTAILYGRMMLTVGISLYTTRLILNALGSTDFGIVTLISGVIVLLSFLNGALSSSTQRFLSFYHGDKNIALLRNVFAGSLILHFIIGVVIVGILQLAGIFLFSDFLNIPEGRVASAQLLYHFISLGLFFTIITVPFSAALIAHENMLTISIISVVETLLKLGAAVVLFHTAHDKLVVYGLMISLISLVLFLVHFFYCKHNYIECTYTDFRSIRKKQLKELGSFASWNVFGSICGLAKDQGLALLLNLFSGPVVNGAYGIATGVSGQVAFLSATLQRAITPQIIKSEGAGDRQRMLRLSMMASKSGFFLLAFIAIPCMFEMDFLLQFWLGNVPEYTGIFCILILLSALVNQLTIGLQTAFQASGRVEKYQIIVGAIVLSNLPIAYLLLRLNLPLYYPLVSFVVLEFIACYGRISLLHQVAGLSRCAFVKRVIAKEVVPTFVLAVSCFLVTEYAESSLRFLFTFTVPVVLFLISVYFTGLCRDEKELLKNTLFVFRSWYRKHLISRTTCTR